MATSLLLLACLAGLQEPRAVARTFTSELELATETFEITASEDGRSAEQQGPRLEREEAYEIEIEDSLFDGEQPPRKFTRFYRTVMNSLRLSGLETPLEKTVSAGLEGRRVTFEREGKGRYARSCEDTDVRPVQLNRLRADLSLARFLPPADDAETDGAEADETGASWTVSFAEFARVLAPLEDRPRRPHPKSSPDVGGLNVAPAAVTEPIAALLAGSEGELTLTPRAAGKDDELPRNADLTFRFEASFDGSGALLAAGQGKAEDEVELVYEGTGTLAWDPEGGRIELQCQGEVRMSERFTVRVEVGGKAGEARGRLALTGTLALGAREERGE